MNSWNQSIGVSTMIDMKKRTFIQAEVSEEYKEEFKRCIRDKFRDRGVPVDADRFMGPELRRVLEQEYPSLKALADKERGIGSEG